GNGSTRAGRAFYGLTETEVSANLDAPVPFGFTLSGELDGLWFDPDPSALFDALYNEAGAPGLHTQTTYVRPRLAAAWRYPPDETLYGFSTGATVAYEFYEALSGGKFSFARLDARWNISIGLDREQRFGAVHFASRLGRPRGDRARCVGAARRRHPAAVRDRTHHHHVARGILGRRCRAA